MGYRWVEEDMGPNLGAANRAALMGSDSDHVVTALVVTALAADLFSLQGLRNLGPMLRAWRFGLTKRTGNWCTPVGLD
jgi:chromosome partitioning protein